MNELEKDLTIDPSRLDIEWIGLPSIYFKYREEEDDTEMRMRKLKLKIDFEVSKLDGQIRLDPSSFTKSEKPTESQIKCCIESNESIFELRMKMLDLEKRKKLLSSASSALEMKRDALKNLVTLLTGEYFSTKTYSKKDGETIEGNFNSKRNVRREIRERMNPKKGE